ncbi:MAG: retropepsin-like domain-containing protein [Armatimonadetes bacterium]|nr:retropepsin-like domain-containing protein [Armatimonadota bacterium]
MLEKPMMCSRHLLACALLALLVSTASADAQTEFLKGNFAAVSDALKSAPANDETLLLKAKLALLSNRLDEAEAFFKRLPESDVVTKSLAEIETRRLHFLMAARLWEKAGKTAFAAKLAAFGTKTPYQTAAFKEVHVPFVRTDPLPVVKVSINGKEPVFFIIDNGGGELIVDKQYVESLGVKNYGEETGAFAGGKKAAHGQGIVDTVELGGLKVSNVPVSLASTAAYIMVGGGNKISGIIGTTFLSQFRFTLDYPKGELVLQPRNSKFKPLAGSVSMPIWLGADHLILATGTVNKSAPMLMLVDTGLALQGYGLALAKSTLDEIGYKPKGTAEGVGGGGKVSFSQFDLESASLGDVRCGKIGALAGVFPPSLENGQGYRIGGLVSHEFFKPYRVTFDLAEMKLYLVKA